MAGDVVYAGWRDQVALRRRHATGRFIVADRLGEERQAVRSLPHQRVELHACGDRVWISWRGQRVADYERCYGPGSWIPEPRVRPEPPPPLQRLSPPVAMIEVPELADYAELCA